MPYQRIDLHANAWDAFVEEHGGDVLQSSRWANLKGEFGWQDEMIALGDSGRVVAGALVLYRSLPFGLGTLAYIPRGPVLDWDDKEAMQALFAAVDEAAKAKRAILLKVEPDVVNSETMRQQLLAHGFRESAQTVQPPRTIQVAIDGAQGALESDDDAVLMAMSGSTRRKVRQAYRKGIVIREGTRADVDSFNQMMQETGDRQAFGVHSPAYYERVADLFLPEQAALFMASYEGQDLAGLMVMACGGSAAYFYGASREAHRDKMPTYALQWEAMQWARQRGCKTYDLWGVPDVDKATLEAQFQDRQDGLWGVYGFKRGFGGEVLRYVGAWDRVYRPGLALIYNLAIRWRGAGGD